MNNTHTITRQAALAIFAAALGAAPAYAANNSAATVTSVLQDKVQNIVFIYAENRGFDNLYGLFPGANGIPGVNPSSTGTYIAQTDRDASNTLLPVLPPTFGGVNASGQYPVITQAQSQNLANRPFPIETTFGVNEPLGTVTRDLYHRFFENQMQINGGANDKFAAWADAGGLTMGYYDGSRTALWALARQFTLADNFFQGAFGGSFLNHQYLICACAPEYPNADTAAAHPTITVVNTDSSGTYLPVLTQAASSPASALSGPPVYVLSGNIAPANYFGDGTFRAINTMQPPYQPSANAPATTDASHLFANPNSATTLPPQTQSNIGDLLTAKGIGWKYYAGAWNQTLSIATSSNRTFPTTTGTTSGSFQFHHQPFNYYAAFDPSTNAAARATHLQDYNDLINDAAAGTLPPVSFYKPEGTNNQHAGYASVQAGDDHIAALVRKLMASPQWNNMVIVITYDENGGFWDHVAPPKGDLIGPGTRIPALIISPLAKKGTVDHTQYDTASILRLITRRYGLSTLPGLAARDSGLVANGGRAMGDLTTALNLEPDGPRDLSVTTPSLFNGAVTLRWSSDGVSAANGYQVFVGTAPGGEDATPVRSVAAKSDNRVELIGLTPGTSYYFRVAATLTAGGTSAYSNEASATLRRGLLGGRN